MEKEEFMKQKVKDMTVAELASAIRIKSNEGKQVLKKESNILAQDLHYGFSVKDGDTFVIQRKSCKEKFYFKVSYLVLKEAIKEFERRQK